MSESTINLEKAKQILEEGMDKASEIIKNNEQLNEVLKNVQAKIDQFPILKSTLEDGQTMFEMVKKYVSKEYTAVSPKVIATLVSAFLYMLKKKDLINDNIPILGVLDDAAVVAVALKFCAPELDAFKKWEEENA